jgi:solute:Na+ symporter, SSS family
MPSPPLVLAAETVTTKLLSLSLPDMVIIVAYFAMVLGIGWYLKWQTQTGEDFFLAGREMTAWIAGLSFLSANLGSLELMGWAGAAYQYGILATHWYWIGAIPAMLFLGIVMMPFYYISKTHSVPGYLQLRFSENSRAFAAISFAFMTILMSGVNREADQDGQDDPLMTPAIGGGAVGRADGVAVPPLAVDVGAAMLVDGIVAS